MNDCRSALESVGLDPQLGFLHAMRPGRAALALDLMEEFRAILADRLPLTLINRGQIKCYECYKPAAPDPKVRAIQVLFFRFIKI